MQKKMYMVEIALVGLLLCGIFWSFGRLRKGIKKLRREQLQRKRMEKMLSEENPFFARRICRWIDHPERDPDLTWDVQCGKYPSLLVYLKKAASSNK